MFIADTWASRLDRVQELITTTVERSGDKVFDYLEWPMEQVELLRTVSDTITIS